MVRWVCPKDGGGEGMRQGCLLYTSQQMGTTGADEYMSVITFTLTELKGVRYVNLDFEEGDHASPGTYNRQYYIDRNRPK